MCAAGVLAFRSGGYFDEPRAGIAVALWAAVAAVALAGGPGALWPRALGGRWAVGGLAGLAAWTAASVAWAPLEDSAREDAVRLALYAAALPLAVFAMRARSAARALEPGLAALALVAVGYGLLGKVGVLDLAASARADGRLDQPLTYWNAMGAMAAFGLALSGRLAIDATRARRLRLAGGLAVPLLAAGLVLTYSRGALAAAVLGAVALMALAPEAAGLRRALPLPRRAAAAAVGVLAVAVVAAVAVTDSAAPPAKGATAQRLADVGTDRFDYWLVAADQLAARPLAGEGTASFRVAWLRERDIRGGAADAHSLYLETAGELGIVGLALLGAFVAGVALAARRVLAADRALAAGPCAALAVLAFHAGLDWDWELPALALPALLLAGALVACADGAEAKT